MSTQKKLNKKQEVFIAELIKGKSQRQAYIIAYDCGKVSPATIDKRASELFNRQEVKGRFEELNQKIIKKIESDAIITKERIINELAAIAFSNAADYSKVVTKTAIKITGTGKKKKETHYKYQVVELTDTDKLSETQQRAISGIKQTKEGIEVKFYNKPEALIKLYDILYSDDKTDSEEIFNKLEEIGQGLDRAALAMGGE